ncbi:UDP-glucose/GDP-mannose dehydrogenase family protein [Actinobacteria bacterium YIM 96077]|uniref:UDP-glucose 6-dehydrogenase n=1 Tax=Phytoactinopolyspora halophila TaxID=1981511 RepID=A0A329QEF1_9ACTN|nr:UDP-glucose/GDP-mannose dehydrogenase family protein [Phytoactinopolyspora halophila]AYY13441.1 UDP-glucose/GDP-mannose dehydrogenase family protein [Actinobacteria bacterium YIM 96077]RAW10835.1 UDP-glucose 6-dehydrogenase [Phytoactinopolyspora halophila]
MRISVIGTGYLGAVHAVGMAELGHTVVGVDVDETKVAALSRGEAPFYEPGLDELLRKHVGTERLRYTTDMAEIEGCDVHFICVGTPQRRDGLGADLTHVDRAVDALAPHLNGSCVVVGKSTVPVGTARRLADRLAKLVSSSADVDLAWNPEFLREGFAVSDTLYPDRLVLGVSTQRAEERLREVYARAIEATTPVVVTDLATAELVKVSANAFLATKISFINAISEICEVAGADVTQLADAIGHDERIGRKFLNAGLGFGGGCLPKDIRAFMARAGELGASHALSFLGEVDAINVRRRERVAEIARELAGGHLIGRRIAVLGAAFKPESDDVRDSPALNVAGRLQLQGAHVAVYDPKAMENARAVFPTLEYAPAAVDACRGADVVLHLTEWREFRELDPRELADVVAARNVVDGRNCLDAAGWRAAGWTYRGLGRP